jgi:hypothetical protein
MTTSDAAKSPARTSKIAVVFPLLVCIFVSPELVVIVTCLFCTQRRYYSLLPARLKEKKAAGKALIVAVCSVH